MIVAIIQARMGSTRLPGKVMKEVDRVPLLKYQLDRVKMSDRLDKVVIATTNSNKDDIIVDFCRKNGIEYFRGSEDDVLGRFYKCAKEYKADIIVRLTADCPLSDPKVIDDTIELFISEKADYTANTAPPETRKYPDGSDVEVFGMEALERANAECKDLSDREHVTFYFWRYDNGFKTCQLGGDRDFSNYRLTVDYPEDVEVIDFIIKELKKKNTFGHLKEIIDILEANPEVKVKNSRYCFGMGWKK